MDQPQHNTPRISRKWGIVYLAVIGVLVLLIILFYCFTKHFE